MYFNKNILKITILLILIFCVEFWFNSLNGIFSGENANSLPSFEEVTLNNEHKGEIASINSLFGLNNDLNEEDIIKAEKLRLEEERSAKLKAAELFELTRYKIDAHDITFYGFSSLNNTNSAFLSISKLDITNVVLITKNTPLSLSDGKIEISLVKVNRNSISLNIHNVDQESDKIINLELFKNEL